MKKQFIILFFLMASISYCQQDPAPKQTKVVTIVGATAHIGNGEVIENSLLIFEDGIITIITDASTTKIPYRGTIINAKGRHIYPGFIAPNTTLGLAEIDAVRATKDFDEIGAMNPHIRSIIAYNTESKVTETMRPNGVLIGQITPRGGSISGTSSVVQFDAWNWEDALIKQDIGIHLNWPNSYRRGRWWLDEPKGYKPNDKYTSNIETILNYMNEAKAYGKLNSQIKNEAFIAMQGLFDGSKKLFVHSQGEKEMIDAITLLKEKGVKNIVLVGAYEAYKIIPFIKNNNIPILLQRVHSIPKNQDDDYDFPYKLAKLLTNNGILVALQTAGQMERMNTRNLPFYAGQVVGQGLEKEKALQLITLNPAIILGIDANYGSLEKGKSATLFISEGDALDMRTNILTHAFIDGREISLSTHQSELYNKFSKKYNQN